ncbi:MAG TPA: penicillin-binding protein 2 [Pseudoclavibacter sp.]|nr:penicillin-binding protein 2 [Pseudoclavibacter sp.]
MNKPLRRVTIVVVMLFVSLFVSTSTLQVLDVSTLNADSRNTRALYASFSAQRGSIIVGKDAIASSVAVDDEWQYLREYSDPELYSAITGYFTLTQGSSGLESALNDYLTGTADTQFFDRLYNLITGQTSQGASVTLTIDPEIQQAAWDALGDNNGSIVALDPSTGEILAMVSKPGYDPNTLASHDTSAVIDAYNDLLADEDDPLINKAISGDLYTPGSTFKIIVAAAALQNGYTMDSTFDNPSELTLPNSTSVIHNSTNGTCGGLESDTVTLEQALQYSCNIPFAELGLELGQDTIRETAEALGFGDSVSIPMTSTASIYPTDMDDAQTMLSSFGQYDVRVTPLQMAMVAATIANDGVEMTPNIVEQIRSSSLETLEEFTPTVYAEPLSSEVSEVLTEMMVNNVDNGYASNAKIDGVSVAGKTGTAENGVGDLYTLSFIGFAPADDPEVAIAVFVEDQEAGSSEVAAPIAKKVMEAVLDK